MECKHERIKSVNCVIFCDICGEKLPVDYLVGKSRIAEQNPVETPEKPEKTASTKPSRKTSKAATSKNKA